MRVVGCQERAPGSSEAVATDGINPDSKDTDGQTLLGISTRQW
jgi:hypothetical protein